MGCGASNTLETSEYVNKERQERTKFLKTLDNEKYLQDHSENLFSRACEIISSEQEIIQMLDELKEKYNSIDLTQEEKFDAALYRVAKQYLDKEDNQKTITNEAAHLTELLSFSDAELVAPLSKLFIECTGKTINYLIIDLDDYLYNTAIKILKYDDNYAKIDTFVFLISGNSISNQETYKLLGSFAKLHPSIKNLIIGISDSESKTKLTDCSDFSYIFEGINLSKTIKNFSIVILETKQLSFSSSSIDKILKCLSTCKLQSLGFVNFSFAELDVNLRLCEVLAKNKYLNLIGLQMSNLPAISDINKICYAFASSKNLKGLILGADVEDVSNAIKNGESIIKNTNKAFERLLIDYFKNN